MLYFIVGHICLLVKLKHYLCDVKLIHESKSLKSLCVDLRTNLGAELIV